MSRPLFVPFVTAEVAAVLVLGVDGLPPIMQKHTIEGLLMGGPD